MISAAHVCLLLVPLICVIAGLIAHVERLRRELAATNARANYMRKLRDRILEENYVIPKPTGITVRRLEWPSGGPPTCG